MNIKQIPFLYRALIPVRAAAGRAYMRFCHRPGADRRKVFFSSMHGGSCSDSPLAICRALLRRGAELDLVWQLPRGVQPPPGCRAVRTHTPAALREIATAGCIVDNFNRPMYMLKFADQRYVQTWHGDRGFKRMLKDLDPQAPYPDGEQMDLAVAGSDFGEKLYRSAFGYPGPVLKAGMPRNDALVKADAADVRAARARLGLGDGRTMLYAPTYRSAREGRSQAAGFSLSRARAALRAATGEEWEILIRAHDLNRGLTADDPGCRDVSDYPEMADVLLAADLLITDYSSCAGDYALLHRPMILYQPDLKAFTGGERELYFPMEAAPFLRAESEEALMEMLSRVDALPDTSRAVLDFYGACETGESAERVADWILDGCSEKKG